MSGHVSRIPAKPIILKAGLEHPLDEAAFPEFSVEKAVDVEDAIAHFGLRRVGVLVIGDRWTPRDAHRLLARSLTEFPGSSAVNVVLGVGESSGLFQEFIDSDSLFYLSGGSLTGRALESVVFAAARHFQRRAEPAAHVGMDALVLANLLDYCDRVLLQTDLCSVGRLVVETINHVIGATGQCLIYDADGEVLRPADNPGDDAAVESASCGLTAYVARTGDPIHLDDSARDPRSEVMAPNGPSPSSRFIGEPIIGADEGVIGVLVATRDKAAPTFARGDAQMLRLLALYAAPVFTRIVLQDRMQRKALEQTYASKGGISMFRREAIEHNMRGWTPHGQLIETSPRWLRPAYWALLALLITGILWGVLWRTTWL